MNYVYNGQSNKIMLSVTNHDSKPFTLNFISGQFKEVGGRERPIRNTTALKYAVSLPPKSTKAIKVPYAFYTELKPQDLLLTLYADLTDADKKPYRITAYEAQVTILEPKGSWLDPQLYILYVLIAAFLTGMGYFAYTNFFPAANSKKRRGKKSTKSASGSTSSKPAIKSGNALKGSGQYEDEWIPDLHKKKSTGSATALVGQAAAAEKRRRELTGVTSDCESGTDTASVGGTPRRRSARKRN